jgi:hypothetical protein
LARILFAPFFTLTAIRIEITLRCVLPRMSWARPFSQALQALHRACCRHGSPLKAPLLILDWTVRHRGAMRRAQPSQDTNQRDRSVAIVLCSILKES